MEKALRGAIYARVSTDDKGQDSNQQIEAGTAFFLHQGITLVKTYVDDGFSGTKGEEHRPGLKAMFQDAQRGLFDVLWVWSGDRLTRQGVSRIIEYCNRLKECKVRYMSHSEPDLSTYGPMGDAILGIYGALWELHIKALKEGVKRAYNYKKTRADLKGERVKWGRKRSVDYDLGKAVSLCREHKGIRPGYRAFCLEFPDTAPPFSTFAREVRRELLKPREGGGRLFLY
jgi:DNA invertase Pin-like site-specific DNA recombinase